MSQKKRHNASDTNKQASLALSQEEQSQLQQLLTQYNQVAQALYNSTFQPDAETALTPITSQSEGIQIAYMKALSKENTTAAADVLAALNALAPAKEVRKEARRSLIRLESTKTYPQWTPPPAPAPEVEEPVSTNPPRFWKGLVTDTREMGEMQLILCWEQGADYKEIRMLGFLLDFWSEGVKDFFTEVNSKRHMENHIERMRQEIAGTGIRLVSCSLAEGRRILQEAQAINTQHKTRPHRDFTRHLPIIRELILEAPEAEEDEDEAIESAVSAHASRRRVPSIPTMPQDILDTFFPGMANEEVVGDFIDAWSSEDYEMAYDLLSSDSPLRDGLSREEWVAHREQWQQEAHPANINVAFIAEHDEDLEDELEEEINSDSKSDIVDEIDEIAEDFDADEDEDLTDEPTIVETAWSLEFAETPLTATLKEIPHATAFYKESKESGRHWFWVNYTLVEEDGNLRIHDLIDEGANALQLSVEELQQRMEKVSNLAGKRLQELENQLAEAEDEDLDDEDEGDDDGDFEDLDDEDLDDEDEDEDDDEDEDFLSTLTRVEEAMHIVTRYMHYTDALIAQAPETDPVVYRQAYDFARVAQDFERAAVYLQQLADHFPDQRAKALRDLTLVQLNLAYNYSQEEETEKEQHFIAVAEATIREAITLDNAPQGLITLAQILIGQNKQMEEAEALLRQAEQRSPDEYSSALIEANWAKIAEAQDQKELALQHYQRAAEISPTFPKIWINIGFLQYDLKQYEEAIQSLKRSVETNPDDLEGYIGLGEVYRNGLQDYKNAEEILLQGLEVSEESSDLLGSLAMVYIEQGNIREAERYLDIAEEIDPDSAFIKEAREAFELTRAEQRRAMRAKGEQRKKHKAKPKKR
jgi:tetratricopeptide (TPR) repeat protein